MSEVADKTRAQTDEPWLCKRCGVRLGTVQRRIYPPTGQAVLWLVIGEEDDGRFETAGYAVVTCPRCHLAREWFPDRHGLEMMLRKLGRA
jgi:hypothetical protein